jgi:hypothetical protein
MCGGLFLGHRPVKVHLGALQAHSLATEAQHGGLKTHFGAFEAHPGIVEQCRLSLWV